MQDFCSKYPPIQGGTNITKYCDWDRNLKNIWDHFRPEPLIHQVSHMKYGIYFRILSDTILTHCFTCL